MSEHLRRGFYSSSSQDLRLVLLGNIGCGKTSSGDTILGQMSPVTPGTSRRCQLRQGVSEGRKVTLVEAPRWFWNRGKMEDGVKKETQRALSLLEPGPHAFLLLIPVSQFTEMECRVPGELQELFGEDVLDHTLVLLTCGDYLMGRTVEGYLQVEHEGLRQIVDLCEGRHHIINNRRREDREQVKELFEKVDTIIQAHGAYTKKVDEQHRGREVNLERQERVASFSDRQEEKPKLQESTYTTRIRTLLDSDKENMHSRSLERMRNEEEHHARQSSNGLHSSAEPERQIYDPRQLQRTPSYTLNAEGALLSQMSEDKPAKKHVSTFHHRINSTEGKSEEVSPASPASPASPSNSSVFFSSAPSTPTTPTTTTTPSTHTVSPVSVQSAPELRLVLLGRSGSGKSSTGNILLGRDVFESFPDSLTPITQECVKKKAMVAGKKVAVIDTPDWFNSERPPEEVRAQISSCVALSSPGPHAFFLCVPLDHPAKTELQALKALEVVFGPEAVQRYTLVLFTHADQLKESESGGVEAYIAAKRPDLLKLVEKCGDRFHILESGPGWRGRRNVEELLEKVERTVKEAGGESYSCPAFQEAEDRVRQRQAEITRERRRGKQEEEKLERFGHVSSERRVSYPYMETVAETEERAEEIEKMREEAEMSVSTMNIESLPQVSLSDLSPSLLQSTRERLEALMKAMPKYMADGSVWVGDGAKKVYSSPVWGSVGSQAQNVQKMVVDSSVWGKVGSTAGHVSKLVGDRVPKVVVDSPVWSKVGSGAKIVADSSKRVGSGLGTGAKNLAKNPVWGTVGSGAKNSAKMMADGSMKVGAGIGAGAKKVAQSPVWGKMGSGAKEGVKAGAKMVAESPMWEKMGTAAKKVPKVVIGGALLGLILGVILGGVIGGAIGTAAGSAVAEVGRRKFTKKDTDDVVNKVQKAMSDGANAATTHGEKVLKRE